MTEKEIILAIINRLGLQNKIIQFEDGNIEFKSGWESIIVNFDDTGSVKSIH